MKFPKISFFIFLFFSALTCQPSAEVFSVATDPLTTKLLEAARNQIGKTTDYDPAYTKLSYPNGDVPIEKGVCTDVVIRAYRGIGVDLQKIIHEDMKKDFANYPKIWGLSKPDPNIDHRRVPNLQYFFKKQKASLPVTTNPEDYKPGDLVTSLIDGKLPHIMIVSDKISKNPFVIHNIGRGAVEEDSLFEYPITGHYRWGLGEK